MGDEKSITLEQMYGDDLTVRNTFADMIEYYNELKTLREEIKDGEAAALAEWREKNKEKIERALELTTYEQNWLKALNDYVEQEVIEKGRKQFFDRSIVAQVRKRAGEYNYGELFKWARQRRLMDLFTVPKKPGELLLKHLRDHDEESFNKMEEGLAHEPLFLELDEAAAVKEAISTTPSGGRRFPSAPVPLETYVTKVSMDSLHKLLTQIAVEVDVDSREPENGKA